MSEHQRISLWLTPEEVEELTGRKQRAAQCRTLVRMGIPFLPNGVGRPLVERAVVVSRKSEVPRPRQVTGPNLELLRSMSRKRRGKEQT